MVAIYIYPIIVTLKRLLSFAVTFLVVPRVTLVTMARIRAGMVQTRGKRHRRPQIIEKMAFRRASLAISSSSTVIGW